MIGIVADTWAAKTVQRNLSHLSIPCTVVVPKSNATFSDKLEALIFIPKAISHGAQNRARAWGARTGKPVICLAKNIALHDELLRAGLITIPSPPPTIPIPPEEPMTLSPFDSISLSNYRNRGQWLMGIADAHPDEMTQHRLEKHPEWPDDTKAAEALVAYFFRVRSEWRNSHGLSTFRSAAKGTSREGRRDLPINFMPSPPNDPFSTAALKATAARRSLEAQVKAMSPARLDPPRLDYPSASPLPSPSKPPVPSLSEPMEEIRTAIEMLRNMLRQYGVERAEITAWNGCTLSNTPRTVSEELTITIESE